MVRMMIMTRMTMIKDEEMSARGVDDEDWTGLIGISVRRILLTLIPRRRIIALIISVANSEIPIAFDHRVAFSSQWHKSQ